MTTEAPVLQFYNLEKLIWIKTNASKLAITGYLMQLDNNNKWCLIAYYSKKMSLTKQNYNINDQKLLAIIACLDEWHIYIQDAKKTEIYTDHQNLFKFTTTKKLNTKQFQ